MKHTSRDPKTGRFVATKEKAMRITTAKPRTNVKKAKVEALTEEILKVLSATYGIQGTTVNVNPEDVKFGKKVSNKMAGCDPAPKQKKTMTVTFSDGSEKVFNEGEVVTI